MHALVSQKQSILLILSIPYAIPNEFALETRQDLISLQTFIILLNAGDRGKNLAVEVRYKLLLHRNCKAWKMIL